MGRHHHRHLVETRLSYDTRPGDAVQSGPRRDRHSSSPGHDWPTSAEARPTQVRANCGRSRPHFWQQTMADVGRFRSRRSRLWPSSALHRAISSRNQPKTRARFAHIPTDAGRNSTDAGRSRTGIEHTSFEFDRIWAFIDEPLCARSSPWTRGCAAPFLDAGTTVRPPRRHR